MRAACAPRVAARRSPADAVRGVDVALKLTSGDVRMRWRAARLRVLAWLLRRTHRDFPGRWRVERFAVREVRSVGPRLRPVVVRTRDGFCIEADPAEWVGQYVYVTGRYEEHTAALMARLCALRHRGYAAFAIDGAPLGQVTGQINAYFTKRGGPPD